MEFQVDDVTKMQMDEAEEKIVVGAVPEDAGVSSSVNLSRNTRAWMDLETKPIMTCQ